MVEVRKDSHCPRTGTKAQLAWWKELLSPSCWPPFFSSPCPVRPFLCRGPNIAGGDRGNRGLVEPADQSLHVMHWPSVPLQAARCGRWANSLTGTSPFHWGEKARVRFDWGINWAEKSTASSRINAESLKEVRGLCEACGNDRPEPRASWRTSERLSLTERCPAVRDPCRDWGQAPGLGMPLCSIP